MRLGDLREVVWFRVVRGELFCDVEAESVNAAALAAARAAGWPTLAGLYVLAGRRAVRPSVELVELDE